MFDTDTSDYSHCLYSFFIIYIYNVKLGTCLGIVDQNDSRGGGLGTKQSGFFFHIGTWSGGLKKQRNKQA